jgi:hypothetical protein
LWSQRFAINSNVDALRVDFGAKLVHSVTIDSHPPSQNQRFGVAPR